MHGNSLGISIKQRTKQYSKGEQLSPSAFAISRIPTCQKVSLWTKTEKLFGCFRYKEKRFRTVLMGYNAENKITASEPQHTP